MEPEEKQLSNLLENGVQCNVDTLNTMADGVRVAHVGSLCEPILKKYCTRTVVSVVSYSLGRAHLLFQKKFQKEDEINEALKLSCTRMKRRIEPTAALAFAGVLYHKPAHIKNPLVILCGGNVDTNYIIN